MRVHTVLLVGLTLGFAGCAEKEEAAPDAGAEMEAAAPEVEAAMEESAPESVDASDLEAAATNETTAVIEGWRDEELLNLMHVRAERLDEVNYALDDGDLEAAKMPAKWLAEHRPIEGLPEQLQPFVDGMRAAAVEIGNAENVEAAKLAAKGVVVQCQACHAATGASIQ